jgi:hypothetical protein
MFNPPPLTFVSIGHVTVGLTHCNDMLVADIKFFEGMTVSCSALAIAHAALFCQDSVCQA